MKSSGVFGAPATDEPGLWQLAHRRVSTRVACAVSSAWQPLQVAVATISRCVVGGPPAGTKSSVPAARG